MKTLGFSMEAFRWGHQLFLSCEDQWSCHLHSIGAWNNFTSWHEWLLLLLFTRGAGCCCLPVFAVSQNEPHSSHRMLCYLNEWVLTLWKWEGLRMPENSQCHDDAWTGNHNEGVLCQVNPLLSPVRAPTGMIRHTDNSDEWSTKKFKWQIRTYILYFCNVVSTLESAVSKKYDGHTDISFLFWPDSYVLICHVHIVFTFRFLWSQWHFVRLVMFRGRQ